MIHFISGLPRSGSTLLAALLRQHPAFTASFQTPVGQIVTGTIEQMSYAVNEGACLITRKQREQILSGIFTSYYTPSAVFHTDEVIFDSNRRWCAHMALLDLLFPGSKVITCVRDVPQIIASFERLHQQNPEQVSRIIKKANTNIYDRMPTYLDKQGPLGFGLHAFREAYYGPYAENLYVIEYEQLAKTPLKVLRWLHEELGLRYFEYDVHNVQPLPGAEEFDRNLGIPGLHVPKPDVAFKYRAPELPPDIIKSLPPSFWKADAEKNSAVKTLR